MSRHLDDRPSGGSSARHGAAGDDTILPLGLRILLCLVAGLVAAVGASFAFGVVPRSVPDIPAVLASGVDEAIAFVGDFVGLDGAAAEEPAIGGTISRGAARYEGWTCVDMLADAAGLGVATVDGIRSLGFTQAQVSAALNELEMNPEFYYLDVSGTSLWSREGDDVIARVDLTYQVGFDELASYRAAFEERAAEALSWASPQATDLEKCQAIHDYLVRTVSYDEKTRREGSDSREPYNAYGALVRRSCVCDGYSSAYTLLLRRLGVEVIGVDSDAMTHSWNMVCLDGIWYHVDVTWDDPTPDEGSQAEVRHTYFLRSDASFAEPNAGSANPDIVIEESTHHHDWFSHQELLARHRDGAVEGMTPSAPQDYSMAVWGVDQWYPLVYDGPFQPVGPLPQDGWYEEGGNSYYVEAGQVVRGERMVDGAWRYFNPTSGIMACSRIAWVGDRFCCYDESGCRVTGQWSSGDRWYLFEGEFGAMVTERLVDLPDGRTVYYDARGRMVRGEVLLPDGTWRCFSTDDGDMCRATFIQFSDDGRVCYYDEAGVRLAGLQYINGYEWYFDPVTGALDEEGVSRLVS